MRVAARRAGGRRTKKNSPSRLRFCPHPPGTFGFRLLPPRAASTYSRSVLGARANLTGRPGSRQGPRRQKARILRTANCPHFHGFCRDLGTTLWTVRRRRDRAVRCETCRSLAARPRPKPTPRGQTPAGAPRPRKRRLCAIGGVPPGRLGQLPFGRGREPRVSDTGCWTPVAGPRGRVRAGRCGSICQLSITWLIVRGRKAR
jgi:hypothetical protein